MADGDSTTAAATVAAAGAEASAAGEQPAEASGVQRSVMRQVEYYFSDSNYPKDKFLNAEVAKNEVRT